MLLAANNYSLLSLHFNLFCFLSVECFEELFRTFAYFCDLITFSCGTCRRAITFSVWVIGGWTDAIWKWIKEGGKKCVLQYWITGWPWKYLLNTKVLPSFRVLQDPSLILGVCIPIVVNNCFFFLTPAALRIPVFKVRTPPFAICYAWVLDWQNSDEVPDCHPDTVFHLVSTKQKRRHSTRSLQSTLAVFFSTNHSS